ncbi:hypothetical protein Hanom_Chr01g00046971 [Helianthus anomalus]
MLIVKSFLFEFNSQSVTSIKLSSIHIQMSSYKESTEQNRAKLSETELIDSNSIRA